MVVAKTTHFDSIQAWKQHGAQLFGSDYRNWQFVCPVCGQIQSYWDFLAGCLDKQTAKDQYYFTCLGRYSQRPHTLLAHRKACTYSGGLTLQVGNTITIEQPTLTGIQIGKIEVLPFYIALNDPVVPKEPGFCPGSFSFLTH